LSLMLARQALYHLSHSASHFCVGCLIFDIRSPELFAQAGFKP
jgi:hypothetical protein